MRRPYHVNYIKCGHEEMDGDGGGGEGGGGEGGGGGGDSLVPR